MSYIFIAIAVLVVAPAMAAVAWRKEAVIPVITAGMASASTVVAVVMARMSGAGAADTGLILAGGLLFVTVGTFIVGQLSERLLGEDGDVGA